MSGINYKCLGDSEDVRERRYSVLTLFLKGAKPRDIEKITGLPIHTVYKDIDYLRTHPLNDLPIDMIRDFGKSFYEIKVRELESNLNKYSSNPSVWLGIQKLIKEYKVELLKLTGATEEKVVPPSVVIIKYQGAQIESTDSDQVPAAPTTAEVPQSPDEI